VGIQTSHVEMFLERKVAADGMLEVNTFWEAAYMSLEQYAELTISSQRTRFRNQV